MGSSYHPVNTSVEDLARFVITQSAIHDDNGKRVTVYTRFESPPDGTIKPDSENQHYDKSVPSSSIRNFAFQTMNIYCKYCITS